MFLPLAGVSLGKDSSGVTIGVALLEVRMDVGLLVRLYGTHPSLKLFSVLDVCVFHWKNFPLWKGVDIDISERFLPTHFRHGVLLLDLKIPKPKPSLFFVKGK